MNRSASRPLVPSEYLTVLSALSKTGLAWAELRTKLADGELPGYLLRPETGEVRPVKAHAWSGIAANTTGDTGKLMVFYGPEGTEGLALVKAGELDDVLAHRPARADGSATSGREHRSEPGSTLVPPAKGGATPDYELLRGFLTAACHILFNDSTPPLNEEAFRKAILVRLGELGWKQPSPPTVRKLSRKLWTDLHREIV